jgi:ribosomal protein S18 acetylase RimI-like enzyme
MTIRPVAADDWSTIGELGEVLVRAHYGLDPSRFLHPSELRSEVYAAYLRRELERGDSTVNVADVDGRVVGFVFAGIEPESWMELRHQAGYIHDVVVDPSHRRLGIGRALIASAMEWCAARGVRRVMLMAASSNTEAQRLFRQAGFRPTMIEMMFERE